MFLLFQSGRDGKRDTENEWEGKRDFYKVQPSKPLTKLSKCWLCLMAAKSLNFVSSHPTIWRSKVTWWLIEWPDAVDLFHFLRFLIRSSECAERYIRSLKNLNINDDVSCLSRFVQRDSFILIVRPINFMHIAAGAWWLSALLVSSITYHHNQMIYTNSTAQPHKLYSFHPFELNLFFYVKTKQMLKALSFAVSIYTFI